MRKPQLPCNQYFAAVQEKRQKLSEADKSSKFSILRAKY